MAEIIKVSGPGLPTPVMVLRSEKYEQQELAKEMAERNANPLNEIRPGGFSLRPDGTPVDAFDVEIPESELSDEEKAAVHAAKANTKEALAADAAAVKEKARLVTEAAKVQKAADEANAKANQTAIEAGWARNRAAAPVSPRKGGVGSGTKSKK